MSGRPRSFFRGSEFPRLVLLVGIVLAGWPMILLFARGNDDPKPAPPPTVAAASLKPVVPDTGIEFEALVDKAPMKIRDDAAYSILLRRARETSSKALAAEARRDIFWTHLWERPAGYRGVPIHLEGTARRVLSYEVNPELAPGGRVYEAWIYSDENRMFPYVLVFEDAPPGLVIGADLFVRVTFDGYFLKLLGYRAGDANRAAPMLVGRLHATAPLAPAPAPMVELRNMTRSETFVLIFVLLFSYIVIRAIFQVRKAMRTSRTISVPGRALAEDDIAPADLAAFLRSVPEEDEDDGPEPEGRRP